LSLTKRTRISPFRAGRRSDAERTRNYSEAEPELSFMFSYILSKLINFTFEWYYMNELDISRSLDPEDFEKFVAERVLPVLGLTLQSVTGNPNDAGCDIIAFDSRFGNR
jgi:hypothetical protein